MANQYRHRLLAALRYTILAMLLVLPASTLTSCGDDEPDLLVGYYLSINSQVRLSLYEDDQSQGTSASPVADMLSTTIVKMRHALQIAYPQPNYYGSDSKVIAALDDIFMEYKAMYGGGERNAVCIVKLYRARLDGEVVKKSTPLKTYRFGAIPEGYDESGL